jgi:PAS domain S-box-containing protein
MTLSQNDGSDTNLNLLRATLDSVADGVMVVDRTGKVVSFNRRFIEMWRVPPEVVAKRDSGSVLASVLDQLKDPGEFVKRTLAIAAQPDEEGSETVEFLDGRVFECLSRPQSIGDGIAGRVWTYRDVTERRVADEEIERSLSLLRATLDATAEGVLVVDMGGKIVTFNRTFLEMWRLPQSIGLSRDDDEAIGLALAQVRDPERFLKKIRDLYDDPEAQSFDWIDFKDGRVFERFSRPQKIGDRIVGRVWSFRDATARFRMEERQKLLVRVFDELDEAVLVTDFGGVVREASASAGRLVGAPAPECLGRLFAHWHAPDASGPTVSEILEAVAGQGRWSGELTIRRDDRSNLTASTRVIPQWDSHGRPQMAIWILSAR